MKKKFRKGVFILVYLIENNKPVYLLLKRNKHWIGWEFPKGGIEKGETELDTVKRESKEETGQAPLKIKSYKIRGNYKYDKEYEDRPGITHQTYHLFSVQINSKQVTLDKKEHSDYKWLDFDKAFSSLKWLNQKVCLNYVNKELMK
ncbi:NUDIX domain-containing protein [Candidatus Pacearchaeota archaeon]|nr:hypothetical protein [uncultured archaeon]MBS3078864.1 NUDIX domain-containing protein [Candidatus Pacearchaeota archaeon]